MKKIWFINQNAYLPEDGPHTRHFVLGKYLINYGYESFVFAGNELHHNGGRIDTANSSYIEKKRDGVHFLYLKTHHYEKNDINRIINIISFFFATFKVARLIKKEYGTPDIIYASSMYPTALVAGEWLARKYGIKCICENRDIVPDGFIKEGALKEKSTIVKLMRLFMKRILAKSDAIVFTMSAGPQYIVDMKWDKNNGGPIDMRDVYYINNGIDMSSAKNNRQAFEYYDNDLDNKELFKVVYFGAIRFMNQMPLFIETAKELEKRGRVDIKILMWGNGTKLEEMKKELLDNDIDNLVLKGYVEKKYIQSIASKADLFIGTGNNSSVGKYGMSFNKIFDYLEGGKPIVLPFTVANSIVEDGGAGVEIDNADYIKLADEIIRFADMDKEEYKEYCQNAANLANKFDYSVLSKEVHNIIHKWSEEI